MKKFIYLTGLAGILFLLKSCNTTGYVATEPTYVEIARPERPSNLHIWIDGDWVYSRQTHTYMRKNGYWARPNHGRTYVSGHWQLTPRGRYWIPGHWQRR